MYIFIFSMANIISIFSLAQNSGKTTSAYYLAKSLASKGESVLLIDTCCSKSLNNYFSENELIGKFSFPDFFKEISGLNFFEAITENSKFSFVPFDVFDETVEYAQVFKYNIEKIGSQFDYIIIDTSSLESTVNDLMFSISNSILIPIECEFYGIDKLKETLQYIYEKQSQYPNLLIEGLLLNRYTNSNKLAQKMEWQLKEYFEVLFLSTIIPRSFLLSFQKIPESLKDLKINDLGCLAYHDLASELINKKTILV